MNINNIVSPGNVSREERELLTGQRGATIWFTGISASGKSTIAIALEKALYERGILSYRLDGDNLRLGINNNLGYSQEHRKENVRRAGEISKIVCDAGLLALSSFISPYRIDRESVRNSHEESGISFVEVFVDCSTEEAERRDPKGLYKRARENEIKNFTGVDHPYEPPERPDIHLRSDVMTLEKEVKELLEFITLNNILGEQSKLQF